MTTTLAPRPTQAQSLAATATASARRSYTTRFLLPTDLDPLLPAGEMTQAPRAGDVVIARVLSLGQHKRLESPVSRRQLLFEGDLVVAALGDRYAPDQFEANVPATWGLAHLVAAGGVIGLVRTQAAAMDDATVVEIVAVPQWQGRALNLMDRAPLTLASSADVVPDAPPVIAVVGSAMNSGKSTALAHLVRGATAAGLTVSAGKVTGTGAGGDPGMFGDAGAVRVADFTHFGYASTFGVDVAHISRMWTAMVQHLAEPRPDLILIEIADGLLQEETRALLEGDLIRRQTAGVIFSAGDSLAALAGVAQLRDLGHDVLAVTGRLTSAPLLAREAAGALDVPVIDTLSLSQPQGASRLLRLPS